MILALLACSNDFGLERVQRPQDGAEPTADTGWADTAEEEEEPQDSAPVEDTDVPDEPPPEDTADTDTPDTDTPDEPAPEDDCDHTSDLVYALSRDDEHLYTFDPSSARFVDLGRVDCDTTATPASMAVDRTGSAWLRYSDDAVYEVDLTTLTCNPTSYSDRRSGFGSFGMGYATDAAGTWRDKMYIANEDTLAVLDPSTWSVTTIGRIASQAELSGNADGELWAILPLERVARLAQLDKSTGVELATIDLPAFPDPANIDTFAFATWNGKFYLFVRSYGMGETTVVYEVDGAGRMSRIVDDSGLTVVGAGVSTCAPA
jgi:hypothetical protein